MSSIFAFDNAMYSDKILSIEPLANTTVVGDLNNLRSRQLARGVYIKTTDPDDPDPPGIRIKFIPIITQTGQLSGQSFYSGFGVRLVGVLGLPLFEFRYSAGPGNAPPREITVEGEVWGAGSITSTVTLGEAPWYRWRGSEGADPTVVGEGAPDPVHRFVIVDEANVTNYGSIVIKAAWMDQSRRRPVDGMYIGGIWISNAIVADAGIDSQWSISMQDRRDISTSRSGQAYQRQMLGLRTIRGTASGLTDEQAYGININDGYNSNNIKLTADWWSMAMRETSTGDPVVVIPRTANHGAWGRQLDVYGSLARPISIQHAAGPYHSVDFAVDEER